MSKVYKGLDGIYIDETSVSKIDGIKGTLSYRGLGIKSLVNRPYAEVVWHVLGLPGKPLMGDQTLDSWLVRHGQLTEQELSIVAHIPLGVHPMVALQGIIPLLQLDGVDDFDGCGISELTLQGLMIAAKIPTIIATRRCLERGCETRAPKIGLSFHENFLQMYTGKIPDKDQIKIVDIVQILQMEHGLNASTFAAKVAISTRAPVSSAISAAVGTLHGSLHGGADEAALLMALDLKSPERVAHFVKQSLDQKKKIMGMGHRVYKTMDPRASILKPLAIELCANTPFDHLLKTLIEIERVMIEEMKPRGKKIYPNVDFYKGIVLYALGIEPRDFTPLFAMSRVFGYLAHLQESCEHPRLIRPQALYIGPEDNQLSPGRT